MRIPRENGQILILKNSQKFSCSPPPPYKFLSGVDKKMTELWAKNHIPIYGHTHENWSNINIFE